VSVAAEVLQAEIAERRKKDLSGGIAIRGLAVVTRDKEPNVLNEYGVVIPPPMSECLGDACEFRGDEKTCQLTRHHLHSTAPDYEDEGKLAEDFRDLGILTEWLPECVHREHHNEYDIHVPIPHEKIMKRSQYENKKLKALLTNHRSASTNEGVLSTPDLPQKREKSLLKVREKLAEEREELLELIHSFEVVPEELITGALLLAAPEEARRRIAGGSGVVLPGLIRKPAEVPLAQRNLQEILEAV